MKVVAERVTDTGVHDGKEWLNFSRFGERPNIEPGKTYDITYKEFKGKKYIQKAELLGGTSVSFVHASPTKTETTTALPVKAEDFESRKNRRILCQGLVQAALQSPGLVGFASNTSEYLDAVEAAVKREVAFIEGLL